MIMIWIVYYVTTGTIALTSAEEPTPGPGQDVAQVDYLFPPIQPTYFYRYDDQAEEVQVNTEDNIILAESDYMIQIDADVAKDVLAINYKTELKTGVAYTPVYTIAYEGLEAGLLTKTEYYKDYVDVNNQGTLILEVNEAYVIDDSEPTLPNSAKPALSRTKTWKWYKTDGTIDESNTKVRPKVYDTRRKRHIEGNRRRINIEQQLIDNVGLAGILSGAFTNEDDAYNNLVALQELHASAFSAWLNSGRGSLYNDITNDSTTAWLNTVVPDTPQTQAMCPWMIGKSFREYIVLKLEGSIR